MRRVQRDATKEEFIQQLCDAKTGYFSEIWRLLLFAALLGKAKGRREPLREIDPKDTIRLEVFSNSSSIWPGILHLLGLLETASPDSLRSQNWENSLRAFEEYANGGLRIIEEASTIGAELSVFASDVLRLTSDSDSDFQDTVSKMRL